MGAELSVEQVAWCERAAFLLGPQSADRDGLADLLGLVFVYDAARVMSDVDAHGVMSRYAARDVIRVAGAVGAGWRGLHAGAV